MTKMSAGPPMRSDVWKLRGSLKRTSPRISPSISPSNSRVGLESAQDLRAELAHIAPGAQRQHQVARPRDLAEVIDDAIPVAAEIRDVAVAMRADAAREVLGSDAGDGWLSRTVDVHEKQHVRLVEGGQELLAQMHGACVPVRLEHGDDPAIEPGLGGGKGRADLGGVMAVVVHHGDTPRATENLEPA